MKGLQLIVAATESLGIGVNGTLPWRIKRDMQFFREKTMVTKDTSKKNAVIMGRKSWESIPAKFRPLQGRINYVISAQQDYRSKQGVPEEVHVVNSFESAVDSAEKDHNVESIYIIGGATIYEAALRSDSCHVIHLTRVFSEFPCDTFLPAFPPEIFKLDESASSQVYEEDGVRFQFLTFRRNTIMLERGEVLCIKDPMAAAQIQEFIRKGHRDEPVVLEGAAKAWPCMAWAQLLSPSSSAIAFQAAHPPALNIDALAMTQTQFRVHDIAEDPVHKGVVWEGDCQYVPGTLSDFVRWINFDTQERKLSEEGNESSLFDFDVRTHRAYADYKYFSALFVHHPEALADIRFQDLGADTQPDNIAFWMGSAGTYTPCHQDCYGYNLVVQVAGKKRWTLFPPAESDNLYPTRIPYEESSIFSQVLVNHPDHDRFPRFREARGFQVVLNPGDVFFVPHKWWHFVESLEPSISLNQWFELDLVDAKERVSEALVRTLVSSMKMVADSQRGNSPTDSRSAAWLNPTEEIWAAEENFASLYHALEESTGGSHGEYNAEAFSHFVINTIACKSLPTIIRHLTADWEAHQKTGQAECSPFPQAKRRKVEE